MITLICAAAIIVGSHGGTTAYQSCQQVQIVEQSPVDKSAEAQRIADMKTRGLGTTCTMQKVWGREHGKKRWHMKEICNGNP